MMEQKMKARQKQLKQHIKMKFLHVQIKIRADINLKE